MGNTPGLIKTQKNGIMITERIQPKHRRNKK